MDVLEAAPYVDQREMLVEIRTRDDRAIGMTKTEDGNISQRQCGIPASITIGDDGS